MITQLGGSPVQFPTPSQQSPAPTPAVQTPGEAQGVANLSQVQELIDSRITPLINRIDSLESSLNTLVTSQTNLTNIVSSTNNTVSELTSSVNSFVQATNTRFETVNELISSSKSPQGGNGENGGGTSSAPVTPIVNEESISPNTSCWGEKQHSQDYSLVRNLDLLWKMVTS